MSAPNRIRLKRRRDELAPETLVVEERHQKRNLTEAIYVRQSDESKKDKGKAAASSQENLDLKPPKPQPATSPERRTFHLRRPREIAAITRKRKAGDDDYATVMEKKRERKLSPNSTPAAKKDMPEKVETLKRPGKRSAMTSTPKKQTPERPVAVTEQEQGEIEAVADELHNFALQELAQDRPKITATPKLAGARSREIHRQRTAAAATPVTPRIRDEDTDMEDENGNYVYDTYVLAASATEAGDGDPNATTSRESGEVGYVIITEEDQEIWEHYMEEDDSEEDWNTDEDDENAEGYYAADYPEDELASDDEHDRGQYRYRNHGDSDDEEWDQDTGAFSDEGEDEFMGINWRNKTPAQFANHLNQS